MYPLTSLSVQRVQHNVQRAQRAVQFAECPRVFPELRGHLRVLVDFCGEMVIE